MKSSILALAILASGAVFLVVHNSKTAVQYAAPAPALVTSQNSLGASISIIPNNVVQGDPVEIEVNGTTSVLSISFNGKTLDKFVYNSKPTAILGIDLGFAPGTYPITAVLSDGTSLRTNLVVGKRPVKVENLGIPQSLGGNTPQARNNLINNLSKDNNILSNVTSVDSILWNGRFRYPVDMPEVTDVYGDTRLTVGSTISHMGVDFAAPPGTPVYAMNAGVVRLARSFTSYGNTIVIDHGYGMETLYLHLSEMDVKAGDKVTKGELIGKSGETGYAEGPHLHVSVKINGVSIDPLAFLSLSI